MTRWKLSCAPVRRSPRRWYCDAPVRAHRRVHHGTRPRPRDGRQAARRAQRIARRDAPADPRRARAIGVSQHDLVERILRARTPQGRRSCWPRSSARSATTTRSTRSRRCSTDPRRGVPEAILGAFGQIGTEHAVDVLIEHTKDDRPTRPLRRDRRARLDAERSAPRSCSSRSRATAAIPAQTSRDLRRSGTIGTDDAVARLIELAASGDYRRDDRGLRARPGRDSPAADAALRKLIDVARHPRRGAARSTRSTPSTTRCSRSSRRSSQHRRSAARQRRAHRARARRRGGAPGRSARPRCTARLQHALGRGQRARRGRRRQRDRDARRDPEDRRSPVGDAPPRGAREHRRPRGARAADRGGALGSRADHRRARAARADGGRRRRSGAALGRQAGLERRIGAPRCRACSRRATPRRSQLAIDFATKGSRNEKLRGDAHARRCRHAEGVRGAARHRRHGARPDPRARARHARAGAPGDPALGQLLVRLAVLRPSRRGAVRRGRARPDRHRGRAPGAGHRAHRQGQGARRRGRGRARPDRHDRHGQGGAARRPRRTTRRSRCR